jgi:arsenate reductase (glutaredoxin)
MPVQIFGTKKCKDTAKALRFFKERKVDIHFVDLHEKAISRGELANIRRCISLENLIDKECREYEKLNLKYINHDIEEKLLENAKLFKTPIVRNGNASTVGFAPEEWTAWLK